MSACLQPIVPSKLRGLAACLARARLKLGVVATSYLLSLLLIKEQAASKGG